MHTLANHTGVLTNIERAAIVEEFWASRNAWADFMNADRRAVWERKWAGVLERDLSPGHTYRWEAIPDSRVLPLRRKKDEQQPDPEAPAKIQGQRFYWQPKSLQIPTP
ncbi:MAG TPA: hypothetical protein VGG69_08610 [Rhizomicrobium sp.]